MELFRLLGTIAIDNQKANSKIDETAGLAEKSESKMSKAFSKIGSAAAKVGKVVAVGMAAAGAAIVKIGKDAVASYADYEQLVGGVETLFKDSADTVMQYAQNAFKTAGLSANEYMETVTSFSASLLQSLNGDTKKAAESANLAITDMSDNANKMGTSMEMIQNAYQGFAKQNYTMLDNLKLGYGGTKEEMERLLKDAEKLSGIKYDISSFDDIVQAIHVVQTEMGITGTTAKEASTTIQGSVASMKSAWQNLLTGMADENQNLDALFSQFIDSVVTVGNNIIPRIQQLLPRIIDGTSKLMQQLALNLPKIIKTLLPSLLTAAIGLVDAFVQSLPEIVETIITSLVEFLVNDLDKIITAAFKIMAALAEGLIKALPEVVAKLPEIIAAIVKGLLSGLKELLKVGQKLVESLWNGIKSVRSWIIGKVEGFGNSIKNVFDKLPKKLLTIGKSAINGLWSGFKSVWTSVSNWVSSKVGWIVDKFNKIKNALSGLKSAVSESTAAAAETRANRTTNTPNYHAHAAGGILTKPTIFGYTPATNTYHLGGEAGAEAIAPISTLQNYVRSAVADVMRESNNNVINLFERLLKAVDECQGDTVIPVYIGTEKLDEIVVKAKERVTSRSGGYAYV